MGVPILLPFSAFGGLWKLDVQGRDFLGFDVLDVRDPLV